MKVYIVSSGCVHEGGADRHVALTEAQAIELAEALVREEPNGTMKRDASARATTLACEVDDRGARRVALWRDQNDFVAVHEWETA